MIDNTIKNYRNKIPFKTKLQNKLKDKHKILTNTFTEQTEEIQNDKSNADSN
jgi:hypothetical protein